MKTPTVLNRLIALFLTMLVWSCDRPKCETDNSIFLNNDVTSSIYQNELANKINTIGLKNLRFWLADYIQIEDRKYFIFYTQNDSLCAKAMVKVSEDNVQLSDLIKAKGKGRFNAEFKNLTFEIISDAAGNYEFTYLSHDSIID